MSAESRAERINRQAENLAICRSEDDLKEQIGKWQRIRKIKDRVLTGLLASSYLGMLVRPALLFPVVVGSVTVIPALDQIVDKVTHKRARCTPGH